MLALLIQLSQLCHHDRLLRGMVSVLVCYRLCGIEPIMKLQVSMEHKRLNKLAVSKYAAQGKC